VTHSASAKALTDLILTLFRLNSEMLSAGDYFTKDLRLTSARWQIFGQIGHSDVPLTASQIARNMGVHRQGVQQLVDAMAVDGLLEFIDNPNHQRAKLIRMTAAGRRAYKEALKRQVEWSNRLAHGIPAKTIAEATGVMRMLVDRLQSDERT
jgi:DNA-binding MarR family transcriptional regulator